MWCAELARGERTIYKVDALATAAGYELANDEFEREFAAPQRQYLEELKNRGKKKRKPRPAKWQRDAARMTAGAHDGA